MGAWKSIAEFWINYDGKEGGIGRLYCNVKLENWARKQGKGWGLWGMFEGRRSKI